MRSTSLYDRIKQEAKKLGIRDLTPQQISKIAGTVRFAGLRQASGITSLIEKELRKFLDKLENKSVSADAMENKPATTPLQKIDAGLQNGVCPRCGKKMRDVLLADYTPAIYCDSDCRITLWKTE